MTDLKRNPVNLYLFEVIKGKAIHPFQNGRNKTMHKNTMQWMNTCALGGTQFRLRSIIVLLTITFVHLLLKCTLVAC